MALDSGFRGAPQGKAVGKAEERKEREKGEERKERKERKKGEERKEEKRKEEKRKEEKEPSRGHRRHVRGQRRIQRGDA